MRGLQAVVTSVDLPCRKGRAPVISVDLLPMDPQTTVTKHGPVVHRIKRKAVDWPANY